MTSHPSHQQADPTAAINPTFSSLILGAASSGKSLFAERLATQLTEPKASQHPQHIVYIATACQPENDSEWQQRIAHHRQRRPSHWKTVEAPFDLPATIENTSKRDTLLLVDCLTLWLSNAMLANHPIEQQQAALCQAIANSAGDLILVSNEVGMGVVPDHPLGRRFRDAQGALNQSVAAICDRVDMIIAGLPLRLKG